MAKYNDLDKKSGKSIPIYLPIPYGLLTKEIIREYIMVITMVILFLRFLISYLEDIQKKEIGY